MYKTIDLCAGIGGIRKGFERTGFFQNVLSAEIDEYAARTYEKNFNGDNPRNDLTTDEFKDMAEKIGCDVLLAGFPCQPFSSQGNQAGFNDPLRGTIFFHIREIIERTRPNAIFLENVQNIVSHDKGNTIRVIIDTLERQLGYRVVGVDYDENGNYIYSHASFVRNTRFFGLPQNRPRAYFVAFDKALYGDLLDEFDDNELPQGLNEKLLNDDRLGQSLDALLDHNVDVHYYMSAGYLDTLERHRARQRANGNGFGYCVVNAPGRENHYANTILATGGSGKERNLVLQKIPRYNLNDSHVREVINRKLNGLNNQNIRVMTPTEWGRLQGFIGYGFVDENGIDQFEFPENMPEGQKYKQFGNSVSIPVIETMADFIYDRIRQMNENYETVLRNYAIHNGAFTCQEVERCLDVKLAQAKTIIHSLLSRKVVVKKGNGRNTKYYFINM